jgi:hypothetical protein
MEPMLSVRDMLVTAHMAERLHEAEQHRLARGARHYSVATAVRLMAHRQPWPLIPQRVTRRASRVA